MEMELLLDDLTKSTNKSVDWGKVGRFAGLIKREKESGCVPYAHKMETLL
jgi:hypothetical protein